jgi:hypothetical protein
MEIRGNKNAGAALWQALTGRAWSSTQKASTQQKARDMLDRYGSKDAVAQKLGVSKRTVERYLSGSIKNPSKRNRDKFDAQHRAAKIKPQRAANLGGSGAAPGPGQTGTGGLFVYGLIQVSEDRRERGINPGTKIPDGAMDDVIRIMIEQGPAAAANRLSQLVSQHYVPGMSVLEIHEIDY